MRKLFLLMHLVMLLSAEIAISASQVEGTNAVRYVVYQRGVNDGHLQIVLKKESTQLMVTDIQNFNGVASGHFSLSEDGAYKLAAFEETTGDYGETEFEFITPTAPPPSREAHNPIIPGVPDYLFWLVFVVAVVLIFLLIFGNPLAQKPKK